MHKSNFALLKDITSCKNGYFLIAKGYFLSFFGINTEVTYNLNMLETTRNLLPENTIPIGSVKNMQLKELKIATILIIDDDYVNYLYFREFLSDTNYTVIRAISLSQAIHKITESHQIDLVILSSSLPENFNNLAIRIIRTKFPIIPIISLIDTHLQETEDDLLKAGSDRCISHYTDKDHFIETIYEVL